eukprot:5239602-Amphidinium_carterae.1
MPWDEYAGGFHRQGSATREDAHDRSALAQNALLPAWVHDFLDNPSLSHVETVVQQGSPERDAHEHEGESATEEDMLD